MLLFDFKYIDSFVGVELKDQEGHPIENIRRIYGTTTKDTNGIWLSPLENEETTDIFGTRTQTPSL